MAFNPPRNCIQCLSNCIHPLLQVPNWFSIRSFDHIRRISPLPFPCISSIALLVSCVLWVSTNLFRKTCALFRKMSQEREQVLTRTSVFLFHPSNKCPLHIKSLSGVPEEPGVPCPRITGCTLHTARLPESWVGDTSPCCPRAYTRKVGKKPTTYSFNPSPHSIPTLESVRLWKGLPTGLWGALWRWRGWKEMLQQWILDQDIAMLRLLRWTVVKILAHSNPCQARGRIQSWQQLSTSTLLQYP